MFILFKQTDFITILTCLGGTGISVMGVHNIFVAEIGGSQFYRRQRFVNLGPPFEENASPLDCYKHDKSVLKLFTVSVDDGTEICIHFDMFYICMLCSFKI